VKRTDTGNTFAPDPSLPPRSPLFANAPGASPPVLGDFPGDARDRARVDHLLALIANGTLTAPGVSGGQPPGRADQFLPYLLVRAFPGDHGDRPSAQPCWESCDIWTAPGDPSTSPAIPTTIGGLVTAGQPHTVYAHVWNLGHAPIAAVRVEFYWANPALGVDAANVHLIGITRVDLAPNISAQCHQLVKCPKPWVPVVENGGHECLVVRVEGFGDSIGSIPWDASANRHLAQRNITVVQQQQQVGPLLRSLNVQRSAHARIELTQVGAEALHAVQIAAPHLRLDPAIKTMRLAHLEGNTVTVHSLDNPAPRILPHALLGHAPAPAPPAGHVTPTARTIPNANVTTLIGHSASFDAAVTAKIVRAAPPPSGTAHVLRVAQYDGNRLLGGYTIVIAGSG
jgi:hypothetical protein